MAHAGFEAPPPPPPPDLVLRLSRVEAEVLFRVLKMVGGSQNGARRHIDDISEAMIRAGVNDRTDISVSGTLMVERIVNPQ